MIMTTSIRRALSYYASRTDSQKKVSLPPAPWDMPDAPLHPVFALHPDARDALRRVAAQPAAPIECRHYPVGERHITPGIKSRLRAAGYLSPATRTSYKNVYFVTPSGIEAARLPGDGA